MDDENVKILREVVMAQAHAEARQMLEEAEAEAESLRREAEREAESQRAALLGQARDKAEALREEVAAEAQIEARQIKLTRREHLLDRVFEGARRGLESAPERPDYAEIVRRLAREGVEHLDAEEAIVRFDERTREAVGGELQELLDSLEQELGAQLSIGEPLSAKTGVVTETPDGHRRYDNTLETRLLRMKDTLRAPVHRILVEEAS